MSLLLISMTFLTGCLKTSSSVPLDLSVLPAYPKAGPGVADELRKHCFPVLEDTHETIILCPETAKYLQRLEKYGRQLPGQPE